MRHFPLSISFCLFIKPITESSKQGAAKRKEESAVIFAFAFYLAARDAVALRVQERAATNRSCGMCVCMRVCNVSVDD